jgi:hypothetical protein
MLIKLRNSARPKMLSIIDKLSNIDRYRQTITIIVSSLIVLSITSLRSHAAAALEIEAAKEYDEILKDTRTTRLATTIDDKDEEVTIDDLPPSVDDLPPSSTAPAILGSRSKRARAGTVDYRALAGLSRTKEEIERLN